MNNLEPTINRQASAGMTDASAQGEEMYAGRDGEQQQPPPTEKRLSPSPPPPGANQSISGGRRRIEGRPAEALRSQAASLPVGVPRLLLMPKNGKGAALERLKVRAASEGAQGNGLGKASSLPRRQHPRGSSAKRAGGPYCCQKLGAYGKLIREAAKEMAMRPLSCRQTPETVSQPNSPHKRDNSHPRTKCSSTPCPEPPAAIPSSTSAGGSASRERRQRNVVAVRGNSEEGSKTAATGSLNWELLSLSSCGLRRVVRQSGPLARGRERCSVPAVERKRLSAGRGRLIVFHDVFWRRERKSRWPLPNGEGLGTTLACVPQLVSKAPELPAALEFALVDHYLGVLLTCPQAEVERVIAALALREPAEVAQHLRQTCGSCRDLSMRLPVSGRSKQRPSTAREEWVMKHRRHGRGSTLTLLQGPATASDTNASANPVSSEIQHFLKRFSREVCMTFMDESCSACARRRERARADQPQEAKARGVPIPAGVLNFLYAQVVQQLLFQILGWNEKEAARVVPAVVRQINQYLSSSRHGVTLQM
ncbi:hypothetical protein TRSC58_02251 [Trypanosoma rangeli SC58]|uniref:Uncharacterized protein n=1 Tax=Trypanosoma rangeli SC58 TaxID=429131 RepID=A0A061J7E2_TRYRA|nr:hypothetical protein TRSC58_02251 [Trypanosoma rangeli SC58]